MFKHMVLITTLPLYMEIDYLQYENMGAKRI